MKNEKLTKPTITVVQNVAINSLNKSIKVECRIIPAYVRKTNIKATLIDTINNTMMLPWGKIRVELKVSFSTKYLEK